MPTVEEYITARSNFDPNTPANQILIEMAELEIGNEYKSNDIRNKAVALLVMHWLTIPTDGNGNNSSVGSVKSEKEGDLARTYGFHGKVEFSDPYYSQTGYGLELLALNRANFFLPRNRTI